MERNIEKWEKREKKERGRGGNFQTSGEHISTKKISMAL